MAVGAAVKSRLGCRGGRRRIFCQRRRRAGLGLFPSEPLETTPTPHSNTPSGMALPRQPQRVPSTIRLVSARRSIHSNRKLLLAHAAPSERAALDGRVRRDHGMTGGVQSHRAPASSPSSPTNDVHRGPSILHSRSSMLPLCLADIAPPPNTVGLSERRLLRRKRMMLIRIWNKLECKRLPCLESQDSCIRTQPPSS